MGGFLLFAIYPAYKFGRPYSVENHGKDKRKVTAIFDLALKVQAEHIDGLGHVNNVSMYSGCRRSPQPILKNWDWG